jgi:hypothetical protein
MKRHKSAFGILGVALLLSLPAQAVEYDLSLGGTQTINGAIFRTTDLQTTGTGVIGPFLRLGDKAVESGINSDEGNANVYDATKTGTWTHDVQVADVALQEEAGITYLGFLLDINQTSANPKILLTGFDLYINDATITDGTQDDPLDLLSLKYSMGANSLLLDYSLNPGSGAGDLLILVPTALFQGVELTDFLYLHATFEGANDGFEEFNLFGLGRPTPGTFSVPEHGATVAMLGLALVGMGLISRRHGAAA